MDDDDDDVDDDEGWPCRGRPYTVVKAGGIFLFPRIFPSYFMKILQQIFRKNFLRSIR